MAVAWQKTVGQSRIKDIFDRALNSGQLGHAYLFAGDEGVGKFSLALELTLALLCESSDKPCYQCDSCIKVLNHSHPDFRYLLPLNFSSEHKAKGASRLNDNGWEYISNSIRGRLKEPYSKRKPNGSIPVEWIREMNHAIQSGSTGSGSTVIIIEGIDTFRAESANAMLKTLEEPPPNTLMILTTENIHNVLPTIKSRCQIVRFGSIEESQLKGYLGDKFPNRELEVERTVSLSYGSLGRALELLDSDSESASLTQEFGEILLNGGALERTVALGNFIEGTLSKNFNRAESLIKSLIEEVRYAFVSNYRGGVDSLFSKEISQRWRELGRDKIQKSIEVLESALLSTKKHSPLNMVFVNMALSLWEIVDEQ